MRLFRRLTAALRRGRGDLRALWIAARDPRTPMMPRLIALAVLAYALSPIDLIPDFIPVLGHLDDLILVPLGLWLAVRLIPPEVMADARARAFARPALPRSRAGLVMVVALWLLGAAMLAWVVWRDLGSPPTRQQ